MMNTGFSKICDFLKKELENPATETQYRLAYKLLDWNSGDAPPTLSLEYWKTSANSFAFLASVLQHIEWN